MYQTVLRLFALAIVLILPLGTLPAWAQEASPAAVEEALELPPGVAFALLTQFAPVELPDAPVVLNVVRLTFEPGTEFPPHPHPGMEIAVAETGSGSIRTIEGPMAQLVPGGAGVAATPEAPSEEVFFTAGDAVIVPAGNISDASAGDEGFTALVFEFTTQAAEATPEP